MPPGEAQGPAWFRVLVQDWVRALLRRGRAAGTIATYSWPCRDLGRWLEAEGVDASHLLEPHHLVEWQDSLVGAVSPKSRSVYVGAIRGLMRWAGRHGHVAPGLAEWVDPVEVPEIEPLVLESDQLQAVIAHYQLPRRDLLHLRDRALFWFLLTSSLRISEALQLNLDQLKGSRWVVRQKGGGEKTVVISTLAREWLGQYLAARGRDREPAVWIYVGPLAGRRRLTRADANAIWRRLCRRLDIPVFTSRFLRGTSATELNEQGNTPMDVAKHLGHRGLGTVMRYTAVRMAHRQQMADRLDHLVPPVPAPPAPGRRRRRRPPKTG